ncbi:hypothetical protein [Erythrobacter sp.]
MKDLEYSEAEVIDLGKATTETKGDAIVFSDGSGGKLESLAGIVDD